MKRLVMAATVAAMVGSAARAETVAVTADRLLDVATGRYVEKPLVVITDGRVTSIGNLASTTLPAGTKTIDLGATTLLPGLIDMHTHLASSPRYGGYSSLRFTDSFWTVIAVRNGEETLKAGFTTVRNVGSPNYADVALKQAIEEGLAQGPRIVPAGWSFGSTGGHCDETWLPPSLDAKAPLNADSPDEARRSVRTLKKYGARVIKICATGGVFDAGASVGAQQMTFEEMKAVADEAHMDGMKVAAHAHGAEGIKTAIRAGIDTIEHASLADDEGIRLAKEKGAWFVMDIYNTEYTQAEGKKNGVEEISLRKDAEIAEAQRQTFARALKAGVKMAYGTDTGVYPHGENAKQFAIMVRYGATPLQAIQTATLNAAQALGWEKDVGQIKAGAWGDLIAVAGDPLKDVTVLEKPVAVIKGGVVVKGPN